MLFKTDDSLFYYDENILCHYYNYIVKIIKIILNKYNLYFNINFSNKEYNFDNNNISIKIFYNVETTLVKPNNVWIYNCPSGKVLTLDKSQVYQVRIDKFDLLNKFDIIIDYSNPNIYNISTCEEYSNFYQKLINISAIFYFDRFNFNISNRLNDIITTFINPEIHRRKNFLNNLNNSSIKYLNFHNCFDLDDLYNVYCNSKIIINVHQTDYHDTLEELRILPALMCGVIVISENGPLKELLPYKDYIIWSSYDNIIDTVKDVLLNYKSYHEKIFNGNLKDILNKLHNDNIINLKNRLEKFIFVSNDRELNY